MSWVRGLPFVAWMTPKSNVFGTVKALTECLGVPLLYLMLANYELCFDWCLFCIYLQAVNDLVWPFTYACLSSHSLIAYMKRTKLVYHAFFTHWLSGRVLDLIPRRPCIELYCLFHPDDTSMHISADDINFETSSYTFSKEKKAGHQQHVNCLTKTRLAPIKHDCQHCATRLFMLLM